MVNVDSIIGARLAAERHKCGLTQKKIAERIGMSESRISRIGSGQRTIRVIELIVYADALERPPAQFLIGLPGGSDGAAIFAG